MTVRRVARLLLASGICAISFLAAGCCVSPPISSGERLRTPAATQPASAPASKPAAVAKPRSVSPSQAAIIIRQSPKGPGLTVVDTNTPADYAKMHVAGAINLPPGMKDDALSAAVKDLDHGRTYLFYCMVGGRAGSMANRFAKLGFRDLVVVSGGGIRQLKGEGLPMEPPPASAPAKP